jgi:hypothetical protein
MSILKTLNTALKAAKKGKELYLEVKPFVQALHSVYQEHQAQQRTHVTNAPVTIVDERGNPIAVWDGTQWRKINAG